MKSFTLLVAAFCSILSFSHAQTLQFSQAKIVSSTLETVPAGKTWKVTSIYGDSFICFAPSTPYLDGASGSYDARYVGYVGSSFKVNGNNVFSFRTWKGGSSTPATTLRVYNDSQCTNAYTDYNRSVLSYDISPNPNVLPMWLPEGTTVQTNAASIFLSVIEFDVIP